MKVCGRFPLLHSSSVRFLAVPLVRTLLMHGHVPVPNVLLLIREWVRLATAALEPSVVEMRLYWVGACRYMAGGLDTSASLFNAPSVLSSSTGGVHAPLRHTNRRGASCRCLSSATSAEELSGTTVAVFRPADQALPSSLLEPWSAPTSLRMWLLPAAFAGHLFVAEFQVVGATAEAFKLTARHFLSLVPYFCGGVKVRGLRLVIWMEFRWRSAASTIEPSRTPLCSGTNLRTRPRKEKRRKFQSVALALCLSFTYNVACS